jgi:hypothetical protein
MLMCTFLAIPLTISAAQGVRAVEVDEYKMGG